MLHIADISLISGFLSSFFPRTYTYIYNHHKKPTTPPWRVASCQVNARHPTLFSRGLRPDSIEGPPEPCTLYQESGIRKQDARSMAKCMALLSRIAVGVSCYLLPKSRTLYHWPCIRYPESCIRYQDRCSTWNNGRWLYVCTLYDIHNLLRIKELTYV